MTTKKTTSSNVTLMQVRLKAAKLRSLAVDQEQYAAAYNRQAAKPFYAGQAEICMGKAAMVKNLAAQTRAEADLIEADAEAELKGQER